MLDDDEGFRRNAIPLDAVVIDSPWATQYNTWKFSPHQFPDAHGMIARMRADGVRTVVWVTPWVNLDSRDGQIPPQPASERLHAQPAPNYAPAAAAGHFVTGTGGEPFVTKWWMGTGSVVDFMWVRAGSIVVTYPATHVAAGLGDVPEHERPLVATLWGTPRLGHAAARLADGSRIAWRAGEWELPEGRDVTVATR